MKKGYKLICPNPDCRDFIAELQIDVYINMKFEPKHVKGLQGTENLFNQDLCCRKCNDRIDLPNWGSDIPYYLDPQNWIAPKEPSGAV